METKIPFETPPTAPRRVSSNVGGHSPHEEVWEGALEKIDAVFRQDRLQPVLQALSRIGHEGVTVTNVFGHGRERASKHQWRGMAYKTDLLPRVRIEIIAHQPDADGIVDAICANAWTGAVGDGKIWVTPVGRLIRVRDGEVGAVAV